MVRANRPDRSAAADRSGAHDDDLQTGYPTWMRVVTLVVIVAFVLTLVASALFA